jgi:Pyruvate/2-oxoglutarate dehydrogenase complex, dihydrolipoamide dehydrogenase (E3) component, and related enzymes
MKHYDLIVIGAGSAGIAAALKAYDAGVSSILVLEKDKEMGGILQQCIHSGFGVEMFKEDLTGPEYAERYIEKNATSRT